MMLENARNVRFANVLAYLSDPDGLAPKPFWKA
jgi:hypothetical protein